MRSSLGSEARLLAAACQMLTRLPVPGGPLPADWLARSAKFFPLVGAVVGALSGAVLWLAATLWPDPVPALLAVAAAILVTGGLHEDGLADTADSTGGRTREHRLAIMKDPRLGAFGALALAIVLALKVAALSSLPAGEAVAALAAGGAVSRALAVAVMSRAGYAGDRDAAKIDHGIEGPRPGELAVALALALPPLLWLGLAPALAGLAAAAGVGGWVAVRTCRALGGYTGDVLGAVIATAETAFVLGVAARWPVA